MTEFIMYEECYFLLAAQFDSEALSLISTYFAKKRVFGSFLKYVLLVSKSSNLLFKL